MYRRIIILSFFFFSPIVCIYMYVCLVGYANYVKRAIQKARICIKICAVYSYLRLDIVNFIYFVIRLLYIYISIWQVDLSIYLPF